MRTQTYLAGLLFFLGSLTIVSGSAQPRNCNCGVIVHTIKFFEAGEKEYVAAQTYGPDGKIYYKDSMVIEQIMGINVYPDSNGQKHREVYTYQYVFIDVPTRSFVYRTFTDTAQILVKFTRPDSVRITGSVLLWPFYAPNDLPLTQAPQKLTDTVMNGITYQRYRLINRADAQTPESIGYGRCDKKGTMFQFDKRLSAQMGCPLVRIDYLPTAAAMHPVSLAIEFRSEKLTQEEIKVFEAWERNAKNNPVKQ